MLDAYICPLTTTQPTVLEEALALLVQEIDQVEDASWLGSSGQMHGMDGVELIDTLADLLRSDAARGLCAYVDAQPAAVCIWDEAGSVLCLLVSSRHTRLGLDRKLVAEACDALSSEGIAAAHAYPPKPRSEARRLGPLGVFLDAGFGKVGEIGERVVVRKGLRRERVRKVG